MLLGGAHLEDVGNLRHLRVEWPQASVSTCVEYCSPGAESTAFLSSGRTRPLVVERTVLPSVFVASCARSPPAAVVHRQCVGSGLRNVSHVNVLAELRQRVVSVEDALGAINNRFIDHPSADDGRSTVDG